MPVKKSKLKSKRKEKPEDKEEIKLTVFGSGGVGKSALIVQLIQSVFVEQYDPTLEDSYRKDVELDERSFVLDILDTAGQEEFHTLRDQYIRQGEGFIVVFGINNRNSFEEAQSFIKQILTTKEIAEENFGTAATDAAIILIGNKADLDKERTVTAEEAKQLAARYGGLTYFEASAKHRQNVEEAFMTAAREVCVKVKSKREEKKCLIM